MGCERVAATWTRLPLDRGAIFAAARHALTLHQWLTEPDCDQEAALAAPAGRVTPLLAGAEALHAWIERGGARAPMRAPPWCGTGCDAACCGRRCR